VNAIFEALLCSSDIKPTQFSSFNERAEYIREKYVNHKYLDISNYAFCKTRRTQSVVLEEDESIASDIFGPLVSPSPTYISKSNRRSFRDFSSYDNEKPSLFFKTIAPRKRDAEDDDEEEDMFADSATTTSDLFGHGSTTPVRNRLRSFDGEAIEEGKEDKEEKESDDESRMQYPRLAQSVSNFSDFTSKSRFHTDSDASTHALLVPCGPQQRVSPSPNLDFETLKRRKEEAIEREDYMTAAQIKRQMAAMLHTPTRAEIESLESLKKLAVRQEDYIRAAELKARIEHLQNQSCSDLQRQFEASMKAGAAKGTTVHHRNSLDTFFGARDSMNEDHFDLAIESGRIPADEADDIEGETIQIDKYDSQAENASQRFSRSIAETSQHSRLDNMGLVVNDDGRKKETNDFRPPVPKSTGSSSSRRAPRTPVRDPTRERNGRKQSRSRSRTGRETLKRSSKTNEKYLKDSEQRIGGKSKNDNQRRNRSSSRDKKSDINDKHRERSKSRERSKNRDRKGHSKDQHVRDRSKSRDRKSLHLDKQSRDRSKSRDRKNHKIDKPSRERSQSHHQTKSRDRSKSSERRSDKEKSLRNISNSRDNNSNEKKGDSSRVTRNTVENTGSRSRSKSRSRRDPRRKSGVNKTPCNPEVKRSSSSTHPTCGLPFLPPGTSKSRVLSTSMPTCTFSPFSPEAVKRDSHRRQMMGATLLEKPSRISAKADEDISIDESFKTNSSDNVQSTHQRNSCGRISLSRRNLSCDNKSYDVSPKGSHSLHVTRCTLEGSPFDFGAVQSANFFAPLPPLSSPSLSTKSSGTPKRSAGFETPAKPFSKRQLSIGSPAGVEDFPSIDTPKTPSKKGVDSTAKYIQEVERTVARLEKLREKRRNRGVTSSSTQSPEIRTTTTAIGG
jgi:protein-arginine kinase activator protein McsA